MDAYRSVPRWFWLPALLLVGLRFLHLGPELDDPHMWRQADTAYFIWDFYQNGVDFLHPSVCWMGGHKTVILEFPLPEALSAWAYHLLGPHLVWARLIHLAFFVGAAWYFFKIIRHVFQDPSLAAIATLVLLMMPLGIYYSRAVHIDFCAVFFAHGMVWHMIRAIDRDEWRDWVVALVMATLGCLVKVPYVFYLGLPLLGYVHLQGRWRAFLRRTPLLLVPLAVFALWQWHTLRVNAAMPDWSYLPDYHKMDNMAGWYFGRWVDRLDLPRWQLIWGRLKFEVLAVVGVPFLAAGLCLGWGDRRLDFMRLWLAGTMAYLLIFFGLNFIHNYYQLPFLAPLAFIVALPIAWLRRQLGQLHRPLAGLLTLGLLLVFGWRAVGYNEGRGLDEFSSGYMGRYYAADPVPQATGALIRAHTPEDALVVSTFGGLDVRCPLILYHARRPGWSVGSAHLTVELMTRLQQEGATHFALLQNAPMSPEMETWAARHPMEEFLVPAGPYALRIFDLRQAED